MVQQYVSQLRRLLPENGAARIATHGRGYELQVDPAAVDALRFERLVADAADGNGDRGELGARGARALARSPARRHARGAVRGRRRCAGWRSCTSRPPSWRSRTTSTPGATARRSAGCARWSTSTRCASASAALLMLALYRAGRQAEALDAFRDARYALVGDAGARAGARAAAPAGGDPAPGSRARSRRARRGLGQPRDRAAPRRGRRAGVAPAHRAARARAGARRRRRRPPHAARPDRRSPRRAQAACPFKGLEPFDVGDAELFFGRERLVAELVARLPGTSLLGVIGPSGSGKSSAVRAGLLPALAAGVLPGSERWTRALLRPGEQPGVALAGALGGVRCTRRWAALEPGDAPAGRRRPVRGGVHGLHRAGRARRVPRRARERRRRDTDGRLLVVLALRADFYGACASHPRLARLLGANQVLVGPMRPDELGRAIEEPAAAAGLVVEPELVARLVEETAGRTGGLPLLSTTLLELWERRSGDRLTIRAYERTGGVQRRRRAARRARLRPARRRPRRRLARNMLVRLAGAGEAEVAVKRQVPLAELDLGRDAAARRVLDVLTANRLVTVGGETVEVAHEALLREWPRLRGWLEQDAEARRLHRHITLAAREWDAGGRDPGELYRGARLASALDLAAEHGDALNRLEREFLDEARLVSERESVRARRMNRRLRDAAGGRARRAGGGRRRRAGRARPARRRAPHGHRRRSRAARRPGADRGRAGPGAAAGAHRRRARGLGRDPREPARGAAARPARLARRAARRARQRDLRHRAEPARGPDRDRRPRRRGAAVRRADTARARELPAPAGSGPAARVLARWRDARGRRAGARERAPGRADRRARRAHARAPAADRAAAPAPGRDRGREPGVHGRRPRADRPADPVLRPAAGGVPRRPGPRRGGRPPVPLPRQRVRPRLLERPPAPVRDERRRRTSPTSSTRPTCA